MDFANSGAGIAVFFDRLRPILEMRARPEILLCPVPAHELAHQQPGTDAHASGGLMKPCRGGTEIQGMEYSPTQFPSEHAADIRANVAGGRRLKAAGRRVD